MHKLRNIRDEVVDSLWFLPALLTVAGGTLAVLLVNLNDRIIGDANREEIWWVFGGSAEGAKSVLESISGSIITVTGVIFSVTIIALQLASTQFTPRVLRQFMASRGNQLVLGVLIGTFTFTLLVQRTIRGEDAAADEFIPGVAVTVAVALALTSIACLIYFINHAARSVQAAVIIDSAAAETRRALERVFPERADSPDDARPAGEPAELRRDDAPFRVRSRTAGYIQSVDRHALAKTAAKANAVVRQDVEIGEWILPGQHIMSVWPARACNDESAEAFCDALVLGPERTPYQDVKHGVIELMDIAVKAMSPSINDPTTAVNAVHRLGDLLLDLAWRRHGPDFDRDDDGTLRVVVRRPAFDDVTDLAFNQIRHYAASNATVAVAMMQTLAEVAALSPDHMREPLLRQIRFVARNAEQGIEHEHDRERVRQGLERALELAAEPPPQARPVP